MRNRSNIEDEAFRWAAVPGFSGRYEITDFGMVRNVEANRLVSPHDCNGYLRLSLTSADGSRRGYMVHRLVLTAFAGPCPDGCEACHNNGVRTDCRLSNLRWDTKKANQADRITHGTDCRGERSPRMKLNDRLVAFIRRAYRPRSRTRGAKPIAHRLGVHPVTVEKIARGVFRRELETAHG